MLAVIALLAAAAALVVAAIALASARGAAARSAGLGADLNEALAGLASAQTTIVALTSGADALGAELHAAAERATTTERRLADAESRLAELAAAPLPRPPPLPTGRRAPALDDLRATLRAQAAAEPAEAAETPDETAAEGD